MDAIKKTTSSFKDGLKEFLVKNNIITTVAAVTIGFVSSNMLRSLVGDIVFPLIYMALSLTGIKIFSKIITSQKFNPINFLKEFVSFIISLVMTFLFIKYFLMKWTGIDKFGKDDGKGTDGKGTDGKGTDGKGTDNTVNTIGLEGFF